MFWKYAPNSQENTHAKVWYFNKVALQLYWNHTSALVFSCKFAAYFQNTFSLEHFWTASSVFLGHRKRPVASRRLTHFLQMVLEEIFTKRKLGPNKNWRVKIPQIMWRFSSHFLWLWKKMWKDFRLSCFCSTAINIANKLKVDDYVSILHLSVCLSVCLLGVC